MGRLVAIGGGTFEEIDALNKKAVELSGKPVPNVLFIGTALQDSTNPLTSCKKSFKRVCPGCIVKKLSIIRTVYTEAEIDALLDWADIIFVGGGNTAYMLDEWRKIGLDQKLVRIFREDRAVLSGISAGAICWFSLGYTDSAMFTGEENWSYEWIKPGLDLFPEAFCPHYNDWGRAGFDEELGKLNAANGGNPLEEAENDVMGITGVTGASGVTGIALEDRAAYVYDNGAVSYLAADENAHAYVIDSEGKHCVC